jgi:cyclophilin family peptidyl-prolyl cis-trans isomerase
MTRTRLLLTCCVLLSLPALPALPALSAATPAAVPSAAPAGEPRAPLDAELARILAQLPGRYVGLAPLPGQPAAPPAPLYHRIVTLDAPRLGRHVLYHEITRDGFESQRPQQQKIYVFDTSTRRTRNSMRSWAVPFGSVIPAPDRDAAALAALDLRQLKSFPRGCEIRWRTTAADSPRHIAEVLPEDCAFPSEAFRQTVRPSMRYELDARSFTLHEVFYDAERRPLFADPGPLRARRARTMQEVLDATAAADWRRPDPARTLYLDLPTGRVILELAPAFAPRTVENLLTLAKAGWFDGLSINRVHDNFVVQWGDPDATKPQGRAAARIAPEFTRRWSDDLAVTLLPDPDGFAAQVGFVDGLPVAGDRARGEIWPAHCYGALGVGRDIALDSGNGSELYVVIGHAPRQLERNITVVGRVLRGMELLAALPRGTGPLGFYERAEQRVPIRALRLAADLPANEREAIEVLRTDTAAFDDLIEARRNRRDDFYRVPAGHVDLCNVPLPVRAAPQPAHAQR